MAKDKNKKGIHFHEYLNNFPGTGIMHPFHGNVYTSSRFHKGRDHFFQS
jgi:hypothetical protein